MAGRRQTWFDEAKLFAGESLIREDRARVRIAAPPYWWEGAVVLTTERLFVIQDVQHPLEQHTAFWLSEIARVERAGRRRLTIVDAAENRAELVLALRAAEVVARPSHALADAIEALVPLARTRAQLEASDGRQAVG
jgi:hypothetical protein